MLGYRGGKGDFKYNISANASFLTNEVIALVEEAGNIPIFGAGQVIRTAVGDAASSFYVLKTDGIFQNQGEIDAHGVQPGANPGDVRYIDIDGNGKEEIYTATKHMSPDSKFEEIFKISKPFSIESELISNVKAIKVAEISYESNFDVFVAATAYPASPTRLVNNGSRSLQVVL